MVKAPLAQYARENEALYTVHHTPLSMQFYVNEIEQSTVKIIIEKKQTSVMGIKKNKNVLYLSVRIRH